LSQKSDVGGFSTLHFAQCFASAFPHFAQKLLADGLLVPHFEQRIRRTPQISQPTAFVSPNAGYRPAGYGRTIATRSIADEATARLGYEEAARRRAQRPGCFVAL
jgi:hypothetical protein